MCLPISCLKCIVEFEAILILIGGLASFGFTIYLQIEYSKGKNDDITEYGSGTMLGFWIVSSVMIINAIFGIIGGKKKSTFLLFIFNLVNIFLLLGFIALMILGYIFASDIKDLNQEQYCSKDPNLQNTWMLGQNLLCSSNCQCYTSDPSSLPLSYNNYTTTDTSQATKVQQCSQFKTWTDSQKSQAYFIENLEKSNDCSGWCTPFSLQIFYDINSKLATNPQQCLVSAQDSLQSTCKIIGDICAGLTVIMGLMVILTFCLCCHPTKKDLSYYERLAYQND